MARKRADKQAETKVEATPKPSVERLKALESVVSKLNKDYGDHAIVRVSEADPEIFRLKTFETGILGLNRVMGLPGMPRGRFIEIYGLNSVGKTSTVLWIIAQAMKEDPEFLALFIDTEYRFDMLRAHTFGVDFDRLWVHQTRSGEEAGQIAKEMLRSGVDLVVFDSVTGLLPVRQAEGDLADSYIGNHARLMSDIARVLTPSMAAFDRTRRGTVIFTNQIRDAVGQMFGNPQKPTGGHALEFYSSIRLELRSGAKDDWILDPVTSERVGQWVRAYATKNSLAKPFQTGRYPLIFETGIDMALDVGDTAIQLGVVNKGGAGMYSFIREDGSEVKIRGEANFLQTLANDPDLTAELYRRCIAVIRGGKGAQDESPPIEEAEAS